jgi:hypothetical protein
MAVGDGLRYPTGVGVGVGMARPAAVGDGTGVGVGVTPPDVPRTVITTVNRSPTAVSFESYTRQTPEYEPACLGAWRVDTKFNDRQTGVVGKGPVLNPKVLPDRWRTDQPSPQAVFPLLNRSHPFSKA